MKTVLLCVGAIVLVVGGFVLWNVIKYKGHFKTMKPIETGEITPTLFAIKDKFVNAFLLKGDHEKYIAIDAGVSPETIKKELIKCNINPDDVVAVFLTHTDYDHAGGVSLFTNALIYLSEAEKAMIDGTTARGPFMKNSLKEPYNILKEGDTQRVAGFTIKPVLTPGHTSGSTCYIVNDTMLFSGDLLKLQNDTVQVFIPDFNIDTKEAKKSMQKLKVYTSVKTIYTGHFGYTNSIQWEQ